MAENEQWVDVGSLDDFAGHAVRHVTAQNHQIALSLVDGKVGAVSNTCNHVGGPLGEGRLDGDYIVCPWHYWKFHRATGDGEPGYEEDRVPRHDVRIEDGRMWVQAEPATRRHKAPHPPHSLARRVERAPGPLRVLGLSTTAMDVARPRYSTSDALLAAALEHAAARGFETRLVRLAELRFRNCEGFYSKSAHACTWPCSITQMDKTDQLDRVYEGFVHWADLVVVATPIRWGAASSLYYKMVERMNCIQNQITTHNRVLLRDKVVALIITGGQDNVQAVAGQMLGFFAEIGCVFPPFPYVAHSRGWSAEDMENNVATVRDSEELRAGTRELVDRASNLAARLLEHHLCAPRIARGGRKAHRMGEAGAAVEPR